MGLSFSSSAVLSVPELVKNISTATEGSGAAPQFYDAGLGLFFFSADDGIVGNELWKSDGMKFGTTELLKDLNTGEADSKPRFFHKVNGTILFFAENSSGTHLW